MLFLDFVDNYTYYKLKYVCSPTAVSDVSCIIVQLRYAVFFFGGQRPLSRSQDLIMMHSVEEYNQREYNRTCCGA